MAAPTIPPAERAREPGHWRDALHVFALASLAAQPLYDLLARSPEFFLIRRADPAEVLLPLLLFSIGLPLLLVVFELAAGALGPATRRAAHLLSIAVLTATIGLPFFVRYVSPIGWTPLAGAGAVGIAFALLYMRTEVVRMLVGALAPAIIILPAVFIVRTWQVMAPGDARQGIVPSAPPTVEASVVMVVFDEFTLGALLDANGDLDRVRYPAFSRLATDGTWYRNATSVATVTQLAIPALLTGRLPSRNPLGDPAVRAQNLFAMLAPSHRLDVTETYVPFCPAHLCGKTDAHRGDRHTLAVDLGLLMLRSILPLDLWPMLPEIDYASMLVQPANAAKMGALLQLLQAQKGHDTEDLGRREAVFSEFIERLGTDDRPTLHYLHIMLPHEPSVHMPSGAICMNGRQREPGLWPKDDTEVARSYQRHLLQVEFVDGMIGRLIDRLVETGAWDSTLLVVTADHGVSFRPGDLRRALSPTNECDILRVPLFVKAPGQRSGGVSDRNVEGIDVLPTIAELLGVDVPWSTDGSSAADRATAPRADKVVLGPIWPEEKATFGDQQERRMPSDFGIRCGSPSRVRALLGTDERGSTLPFAIGPHREILDRPVGELAVKPPGPFRFSLDHADRYADVSPDSGMLPCPIEGRIAGGAKAGDLAAVALNGTIRAVTRLEKAGSDATFSVLVPESAFRTGRNDVAVYRLMGPGSPPSLEPVPQIP